VGAGVRILSRSADVQFPVKKSQALAVLFVDGAATPTNAVLRTLLNDGAGLDFTLADEFEFGTSPSSIERKSQPAGHSHSNAKRPLKCR